VTVFHVSQKVSKGKWERETGYALRLAAIYRVLSAAAVRPGMARASPNVCGRVRSSRSTISCDSPFSARKSRPSGIGVVS
jgi:hypothetical protein